MFLLFLQFIMQVITDTVDYVNDIIIYLNIL